MRSMQYGPTARKDEANNWIFSAEYMAAYKNNLNIISAEEGTEFQFFNGPQGGGLKLVVVRINTETVAITAREK